MIDKRVKLILISLVLLLPICRVSAAGGEYIVRFNTDITSMPEASRFDEVYADEGLYTFNNLSDLNGLEKYIDYYEKNTEIKLIEDNEPIQLFNMPSDELYAEQWQIQMINADYAWQHETYGNDVIIGVIDSGCYPHDDLKNNLLPGWNYLDNSQNTMDDQGHGTHVSGIIAAGMNDFGTVGAAPKAKIVPLKCFDKDGNSYLNVLVSALYEAVTKYECQVINMSWGFPDTNNYLEKAKSLEQAIQFAYNNGVILVAAVGNNFSSLMHYPAGYENVIGVGSVGLNKKKSSFSQYNKSVFVVAPGANFKSTYKNNSYYTLSGTSQASPLVSAIAAIALSADSTITNNEFRQLLSETADDLGAVGYDTHYGYGLANAQNLLNRILAKNKCYVSPINLEGDDGYVLIKNNTNNTFSAKSLFAGYNNGKLEGCTENQIILMPGKSVKLKTQYSNDLSHFLWSGTDNMYPLCLKRELNR